MVVVKSSIVELILLSFFKANVINNISNNWFLIYDNQEKDFIFNLLANMIFQR